MKVAVNFAHTNAPDYLRQHVINWIESNIEDLDPERRLKVEMYCSKESLRNKTNPDKFKCMLFAKAPWLGKTISVESMSQSCWGAIASSTKRMRQQISRIRKMKKSHKHHLEKTSLPTQKQDSA